MKAILIVKMPTHCYRDGGCELYDYEYDCCHVSMKEVADECMECRERPMCCPLKPVPQPLDLTKYPDGSFSQAIAIGYNMCLKEISGETE